MGKSLLGNTFSLLHFGALLLVANVLVIIFFEIETSRWVRLVSTAALLIYLLVKKGLKRNILMLSLLMLLARDAMVLFYEQPAFKTTSLLLTTLVYTAICLFTFRRLPMVRFSNTVILFGLGIIVLNIFNVYYLSDIIIPSLDNDLQLIVFFTQSAVMLFMALFAFLYNESYDGHQSLHLLLCVIAFIFSDLGGLASYFMGYEPAFYAERIFYIIAVCLLVHYVLNFKIQSDKVGMFNDSKLSI